VHLDISHWNNLDAKYKKWSEYNDNPAIMWQKAELVKRIVKLIITEVLPKLTQRQREITILHFQYGLKEKKIANTLGISQPTVSQHLFGKRRNGEKVGGSIRRIRKLLKKLCKKSNQPSINSRFV
jgi:predicted transcriptional regulator